MTDMNICDLHNYIVVEWNGDVAFRLMCQKCLRIVKYKDIKAFNLKVIKDIEDIQEVTNEE